MNATARIWMLAIGGSVVLHATALAAVGWLARAGGSPHVQLRSGSVKGVRVVLVARNDRTVDARDAAQREREAMASLQPHAAPSRESPSASDPSMHASSERANASVNLKPQRLESIAEIIVIAADALQATDALSPSPSPSEAPHDVASLPAMIVASEMEIESIETSSVVPSPAAPAAMLAGGSSAGVDREPSPLGSNRPPEYPAAARRRGECGTVILRIVVESNGHVASLAVAQSSGFSRLDDSAVDAVRRWRFSPAQQGGTPTRCEVLLPVEFVLRG